MLIQPHFDYVGPASYQNFTEKTQTNKQKKIQTMQNKYIWFSLRLGKMHHISLMEFRSINWLPTKKKMSVTIVLFI